MNNCNNCAKHRIIANECPWGGSYHHRGGKGERIGICNAHKPRSEGDRIRAMSDEELAGFIADCEGAGNNDRSIAPYPMEIINWLRQEATSCP